MTKYAICYLRVSGQSQIDGGGFDRQLEACQRFAASRDLEIVETFREEAVSGTKSFEDRPAFQSLVSFAMGNDNPAILIESLDRLAREYRVQEQLLLYLAAKGLTLYAANTGENITESIMADPMRKALVQIQGIFAELDKSMIVAKLRKGRQTKKQNGGKGEGRYGYGCDPKLPDEVPVMTQIRSMKASGATCEHIALMLNSQGITGRSGCAWKAATIAKILRTQNRARASTLQA